MGSSSCGFEVNGLTQVCRGLCRFYAKAQQPNGKGRSWIRPAVIDDAGLGSTHWTGSISTCVERPSRSGAIAPKRHGNLQRRVRMIKGLSAVAADQVLAAMLERALCTPPLRAVSNGRFTRADPRGARSAKEQILSNVAWPGRGGKAPIADVGDSTA